MQRDRKWEKRVLKRARRGDPDAFAALYDAFADDLFRSVLMPKLGDRHAAEDALSETFRQAIRRIDQYRDQGRGIGSWLARIASNKATDMHRQRARTGRLLADFGALWPGDSATRTGATPEALVEHEDSRRDLKGRVEEVLSRINPRYRRAIEARILAERPRPECAEELGVKLATFDVLMLRALRAFRTEWLANQPALGDTT